MDQLNKGRDHDGATTNDAWSTWLSRLFCGASAPWCASVGTNGDGADMQGLPKLSKDVRATVDRVLAEISPRLREISLQIHDHPELGFQEKHAVQVLTKYLEEIGFVVERGAFAIETAFVATFEHVPANDKPAANKRPVQIGFCSEYDALPDLGHACGHNLIAISGLACAVAAKEAITKHNLKACIRLFGTPAEEGGGGKVLMVERGAFEDLDFCVMLHPSDADNSQSQALAMQWMDIHYTGRAAHAAARPWDGVNALDAVCLAHSNVAQLRQQILPTDRIHGIITDGGQKSNIIPALASAKWIVRSATTAQRDALVERTVACFTAAAVATGTQLDVRYTMAYSNLLHNKVLSRLYQREMEARGVHFPSGPDMRAESMGSTDFGNVSYSVPALHPHFYIGVPGVDTHTREFAAAARSEVAHTFTLRAAAALACAALTVVEHPHKLVKKIYKEYLEEKERAGTDEDAIRVDEQPAVAKASAPVPPPTKLRHGGAEPAVHCTTETTPLLQGPPPSYDQAMGAPRR
ncbi:amidohydrolase [Allomyces macrogynus ATCC 38327]|uniref:Amidohydrolase n=1 Tax=Allomyces macrogynus (strain ATCC 38327) TaxID=578462 RepID=A0A0L0RZ54_ALLM3|nr:amidohydrolase [Allomyces macrogynus ATCC 38327]|eukprot:KNE55366.1 amidohydrolase [Allomyces macrogynus ATCC 38327]